MSTATVRYETEVPQIFELLGGVEAAVVRAQVAMINLSNRIQISRH